MIFKQSVKFKKGFSVLFASLTGSLVLLIGLAILSITIKQITLASAGRESQLAFYAADTGVECALFLDAGGGNVNADGNPICPQGIFGIPTEDNSDVVSPQCGMEAGEYKFDGDKQYRCVDAIFDPNPDASSGNVISRAYLIRGTTPAKNIVRTDLFLRTGSPDDLCFNVTVDKTRFVEGENDGNVVTKIISRGFSTCNTTGKNRFERAIKIKY